MVAIVSMFLEKNSIPDAIAARFAAQRCLVYLPLSVSCSRPRAQLRITNSTARREARNAPSFTFAVRSMPGATCYRSI
jgi:hypothetical protein